MEFFPHSQAVVRKPTVVLGSQPPSSVASRKPEQAIAGHREYGYPRRAELQPGRVSWSQSPSGQVLHDAVICQDPREACGLLA